MLHLLLSVINNMERTTNQDNIPPRSRINHKSPRSNIEYRNYPIISKQHVISRAVLKLSQESALEAKEARIRVSDVRCTTVLSDWPTGSYDQTEEDL